MQELVFPSLPPPDRALSCAAAIVGVGETDYGADYQAARAQAPGYEAPTPELLAATAFERALADSGLERADIDGVSTSFIYGGPSPVELARSLGLNPRLALVNRGLMSSPLQIACAAIASGQCDTIAMIYAAASRAIGRQYGGQTYESGGAPTSYYYYHPWGWSSQAAHWALVWRHYQNTFGAEEADLGAVAMQMRRNAMASPNAVMRAPMGIDDYLAARYIVRPLRLLDLCLVNDGGVCLILRRADKVHNLPHAPVFVAGWGEAKTTSNKLDNLVRKRLRPALQEATAQALNMAGLSLSHVQHLEAYDTSTIHLISQLEGAGFVQSGEGLAFCANGQMAIGGALPVNTSGGMLSGAYMHGWNQVAEITRQLRHEAGPRQIKDVSVSMFMLAETDQAHPLIFTRNA